MTRWISVPDLVWARLARLQEVRHRIGERALAGLDRLDDRLADPTPEEDPDDY